MAHCGDSDDMDDDTSCTSDSPELNETSEDSVAIQTDDDSEWSERSVDSDEWEADEEITEADTESGLSVDPEEACKVCGSAADAASLLLCDGCSCAFHTRCVGLRCLPPTPTWLCPGCLLGLQEQQESALAGVSTLPGARTTATAAAAAAAALKKRIAAAAARPRRQAAVIAAARAAATAAQDDSAVAEPEPAQHHRRGRGRPRLTDAERQARQTARAAMRDANDILLVSITVAKKTADLDDGSIDLFNTWLQTQPAGAAALERGGTYGHLHVQCVAKVVAATPQQVNRLIKVALNWVPVAPSGATVCVRKVTGHGLHTWHGLIGYVYKDQGLPHFRVVAHNITDTDIEIGKVEYLKYGAGSLKKKGPVTPKNIYDKAALFRELHMGAAGNLNFQQTLLEMIRTGKWYPSAAWVVPWAGRGMHHERAAAVWRMVTNPATVQPEDIHMVFFWGGNTPEYPTTGRYLHDCSEVRLQRVVETYFDRDDGFTGAEAELEGSAPQIPAAADAPAAVAADEDLVGDAGLGAALGVDSGYRARLIHADNMEHWQMVTEQLDSLRAQPGSSQTMADIGDMVEFLREVLVQQESDDMEDVSDLATIHREGA